MKVTKTQLDGVLILEPKVFGDERGFFMESFNQRVFDEAVDIRKSSPTFGQWVGVELTESNHRQLWIPAGFAHGFVVTSDSADFLYKASDYYAPAHERSILWNDADIGIEWPDIGGEPKVSPKDASANCLTHAEVF